MSPPPEVAVVVVNHDTREDLLACVDTLPAAGADHIVVVDAGSRDGSVPAVQAAHPDIDVLALPNVGYARGANAGVARTATPVVVVANADTRFAPGSLRRLADALLAADDVAAVGPLVRYPDGRPQASARRLPTLGEAVLHGLFGLWWPTNPWTRRYRLTDVPSDRPRDADWLSGCAIALRRAAFDEVGGFDPGFFLYVEDVDLGYRLRAAGWRLRFEPAAEVTHAVGRAAGRRRSAMVVAHARSLDRFYGRAYAHRTGRLVRPFVRLGLLGWAASTIVWDRLVRRRTGRSTTGE